ncbi:MAG: hypothetical protein GF400_00955 [Candidatus Eisenbacteria bacterium]|nr:hypothetical protein [Candidatus Eisenbacteria bacterium]
MRAIEDLRLGMMQGILMRQGSAPVAFLVGLLLSSSGGISAVYGVPYIRTAGVVLVLAVFIVSALAGRSLRKVPLALQAYLLLVVVLVAGILHSPAPAYALWKAFMVALYWGVFTIALYNTCPSLQAIRSLLLGLLVGGLAETAMIYLYVGSPTEIFAGAGRFYRLELAGQNPHDIGRVTAVSALVVTWLLMSRRRVITKLALAPSLLVMGAYMIAARSKLAGAGFVVSLGILVGVSGIRRKLLGVSLVLLCLLAVASAVALALPEEFIVEGYLKTFERSFLVRIDSWRQAMTTYADGSWADMVFGHGTGSFAHFFLGSDRQSYPHNLLVEILFENGLVGFVLLISCLALPVAPLLNRATRKAITADAEVRSVIAIALAFYSYAVIHSQFSGDIAVNTWLPVAGGVLVTVFSSIRMRVGEAARSAEERLHLSMSV